MGDLISSLLSFGLSCGGRSSSLWRRDWCPARRRYVFLDVIWAKSLSCTMLWLEHHFYNFLRFNSWKLRNSNSIAVHFGISHQYQVIEGVWISREVRVWSLRTKNLKPCPTGEATLEVCQSWKSFQGSSGQSVAEPWTTTKRYHIIYSIFLYIIRIIWHTYEVNISLQCCWLKAMQQESRRPLLRNWMLALSNIGV